MDHKSTNVNKPLFRPALKIFLATLVLLLLVLLLLPVVLCGADPETGSGPEKFSACTWAASGEDGEDKAPEPELKKYSDLKGKTVSMLTGAPFDEMVKEKEPGVKEFTFFNNNPDMVLALQKGKTDALLTNNAIGDLVVNRNPDLIRFPENLQDGVFGFAFAKGDPQRDQWQKAYDKISDETKEKLWKKWTGSDEKAKTVPKQDWPGKNGTVKAAVCDTLEPMSYMAKEGEIKGFDIEMILLIAKELDVHVKFTGMEFSAILSTIQSGKADIGAGSIIATDERRESVDFVDYYPAAFVLVVRTKDSGNAGSEAANTSKTLKDMETAKIGVLTGSNIPDLVKLALPKAEQLFYNTAADEVSALKNGKVEAIALDEPVARNMRSQNKELAIVPELLDSVDYAFVTQKSEKGQKLSDEISEYIKKLESDGTLKELQKKWFDSEDLSKVEITDYRDFPGTKGVLRYGIFQYPPFAFLRDDLYCGYELEIMAKFCQENGYGLEIVDMNTDAVLASVQSGKVDVAGSGLGVTEERKETVLFTVPDYTGGTALLVMGDDPVKAKGGFMGSVKESFDKTFVRENRWKLFLSGILTTMLIIMLSIVFGTILGFAAYMLCRKGGIVPNYITKKLIWLVEGTPVVVLLMIFYYIVFEKFASVTGTMVSVVVFTLIFGAAVFNMLKNSVDTIDIGQTEAAYALGYTDRDTFFKIVFPQALPRIMPTYKGQIVSLIKASAVVGYVAVQDLTKIGDIVRSRTYEAFFPLIAIAVIYFILAGIMKSLVGKVELKVDPRKRTKEEILKGVTK